MVKSIKQLCDRLEKREKKRCESGKEITGAHVLLMNALITINNQSSFVYYDYVLSEKGFCSGFLNGLLSCHYITKEEFHILNNELTSAYKSYLQRCAQEAAERNGDSPEDFDLMSLEGGVAL